MRRHRLITGLVVIGVGVALLATPAGADPKKGEAFVLERDNGRTYSVVFAPGNGEFTPALDTQSNAVLLPVSFVGDFLGEVRDLEGNIVATFTEPGGGTNGSAAKHLKDLVSCRFSFTVVSDGSDPEFPFPAGFTFTGSGTVVGRVTPGR